MRRLLTIAVAIFTLAAGLSGARAQDRIACDQFIKNPDGSWVALENTEIPGLGRKLTIRRGSVLNPGATILSVDIAAMLDQQCPGVLPAAPDLPAQIVPGSPAPAGTARAPAAAPDLQQKYADVNGNIDIQMLTCGQLVSTYQEDAEFVLLWSSGWYNGLARKSALNMPLIRQGIRSVIAYCQGNKDKRLTQAIDAVAKGGR